MPWNEPGSGNKDPWGNGNRNRGDQGPDLEDVINNVRKRFGGGNNNGGGSSVGFSPFLLLLIGAVVFWCFQSFYVVDEGYESIELRFGKYQQTVGAGLQFIAWPIDRKIIFNTQEVRTVSVGYRGDTQEASEASMLTRDENIVDVTLAVQYTIKSIKDLVFNVGDLSYQQGLDKVVRSATESALREVVGRTPMDAVLTTERAVVDADTKELLQKILDRYQSGIQIESIETQDAKPPRMVRDAFDDVVRASQDQKTLKNQAEAYENKLVPNARGEAKRIIQEAEAYKAKVVAEATGEAERFNKILAEYKKAPEITKKRLYIETMESVLADSSKVMIDQNAAGGNSMMYLPIDKIIESNSGSRKQRKNSDNVLPKAQTNIQKPKTSTSTSRRGGR